MSNPNSPCAACKYLRRKCTPECVFAPYFPPDQSERFIVVHKAFGASNVTKLLNEIQPDQRESAVHSLVYEADARVNDPVYGCVGFISILQHRLKQLQSDLLSAKQELAQIIGPTQYTQGRFVEPDLAVQPIGIPPFQQQMQMINNDQRTALEQQGIMARTYEHNQDQMFDHVQPNMQLDYHQNQHQRQFFSG